MKDAHPPQPLHAAPMRALLVLVACLLLSACSQVSMYTDLDERQANEVLAALLAADINADKRTALSKTGWEVRVDRGVEPRIPCRIARVLEPVHSVAARLERLLHNAGIGGVPLICGLVRCSETHVSIIRDITPVNIRQTVDLSRSDPTICRKGRR